MWVRDIFYYNIIIPRSFVNTRRERAPKSLTSARGCSSSPSSVYGSRITNVHTIVHIAYVYYINIYDEHGKKKLYICIYTVKYDFRLVCVCYYIRYFIVSGHCVCTVGTRTAVACVTREGKGNEKR